MKPELVEQITRIVAQYPDLMKVLIPYAVRQHKASVRRQRRRANTRLEAELWEEDELCNVFDSRAQRVCASATGAERERLRDVAVDVVHALEDEPGLSVRQLRKAVRELRGRCADGDVDAAVVYLGRGIRFHEGSRSARLHTLEFSNLPADVLERFGVSE